MSDGLFQGDMLSASEYYRGRRRRAIAEPILRLMRAVFDVAWADASYRGSLQPWVRRRHEAVGWFVNPNGSEGPFAFRDVCEVLGYDVDATRAKICEKLARMERRTFTRRSPSFLNLKLVARRAGRCRAVSH
jgi:hypothetical protein